MEINIVAKSFRSTEIYQVGSQNHYPNTSMSTTLAYLDVVQLFSNQTLHFHEAPLHLRRETEYSEPNPFL